MLPLRSQAAPCASGAGSNPLWTHGNPHIREPPREAAELLLQDASSSPKRQPQQSSQASPGGEILNRNTKIGRNAAGMETCTCEEALGEAAEPGLPEQPVLITGDTVPTALLPRHCAPEDRGGMHRLWRDHGLYTPVRQRRRLVRGRPCTHCSESAAAGRAFASAVPPGAQRQRRMPQRQGLSRQQPTGPAVFPRYYTYSSARRCRRTESGLSRSRALRTQFQPQ